MVLERAAIGVFEFENIEMPDCTGRVHGIASCPARLGI